MPQKSILVENIKSLAPVLGQQIENLRVKAKAPLPNDYYILKHTTINKQGNILLLFLEDVLCRLTDEDLQNFQEQGLDAFSDLAFWQRFERCGVLAKLESPFAKDKGNFHLALLGLLSQHFNNENLTAPHEIVIPSKLCESHRTTDCSIVYRYPLEYISEIKAYVGQYLEQKCIDGGKQDLESIINNISGFLFCLDLAFDLPEIKQVIKKKLKISDILSSKEICDLILSSVNKKKRKDQFKHMLRYLAPKVHGKRTTTLLVSTEEALDFINTISPKLRREIASFLAKSQEKHHLSRVKRFMRFIHAFRNYLSKDQLELIREKGVAAFTQNEAEMWLLYLDTLPKEVKEKHNINDLTSVMNRLLAHVFDRNVNIKEYLGYMLRYRHQSVYGEWQYQSCKYIHDNYPALFEDVKKVHHISLNRTDAFQLQLTTVKSVFNDFIIAIKSNDGCLSEFQKQLLAERGLHGLAESGCDILKSLRQRIQHRCKASDIDLAYGRAQQNALDWFLDTLGIETTLSYPVSQLKRRHHQEKSRANDYYTLEEAVELAFYIEKTFLVKKDLTHFQKLALKLGRIFLKTAWNMTPVFELTIDDIFYFDSPIGGKKTPAVRLFKRRADYSTQWYNFGLSVEDIEKEGVEIGDAVRPVIQDLIEIRDEDSKPFRDALNDDHPFKNRIFLYQSYKYGAPKALDATILTTLDEILKAQGCEVNFTVQRIRKGGLNYIYRKVVSNFKKYKEAGQHSFEVFLQHYLKDDSTKSTATLTKATQVMGDYFHGRELTDDIIILTDIPDDSRQTPNGSCVSGHESDAAKLYETENYKLHKENDIKTTLCADFNACLFCPYYRLVADAEHVWRLLSYRAVVIDSMKASTTGIEFAEKQKENIEVLSNRVDEILEKIAKISPTAPTDGMRLFKEFGIHEDWELMAG